MKRKKLLYPGLEEAEQRRNITPEEAPDFIGGAPNYDKFTGIDPEQVLVWLNVD